MKINLGINIKKLNLKEMRQALIKSSELVVGSAKLLSPVDSGRLRGSISYAMVDKEPKVEDIAKTTEAVRKPTRVMYSKIGTNVEYAIDIEYGTKPHKITAKNGKSLKFKINNNIIYRKSVNHPGTAQQPFLRPAFFNNIGNIKRIFESYLKKSIEGEK